MGALKRLAPRTAVVFNDDALSVLKRQDTNSVGAIVSDPPFFIGVNKDSPHKQQGMGSDPWAKEVDSHRAAADWYLPIAQEAARILRPGGGTIVMGGSQSIAAWEDAAAAAGLKWLAELTVLWNTGKPRARNFGSLTLTIRWHCKPGGRPAFNGGSDDGRQRTIYSNVLVCQKVPVKDREHPAQKPVELTNFLISTLTNRDDLVIDPFCGSGSTLVSAAMCDRSFIGCDQDPRYCDIAIKRTRMLDEEEANLRPIYHWINGRLEEV